MHNEMDLESHDDSEDSDTENRTEAECYDGDVDTESYLSASSSSAADTSSGITVTDPASHAGRNLTDEDKFLLLTSSPNLPRQYRFPVTAGRKFNPSWLSSRSWLRYSLKNNCISCVCFGGAMSLFVSTGFRNWKKALVGRHSYIEQHKRTESHKVSEEKVAIFPSAWHGYCITLVRAGCIATVLYEERHFVNN